MQKKNYSQINFDFNLPADQQEPPALGVRIKSLKTTTVLMPEKPADKPAAGGEDKRADSPLQLEAPSAPEAATAAPADATVTEEPDMGNGEAATEAATVEAERENEPAPVPETVMEQAIAPAKTAQPSEKKSTRGRKSLKALDAEADHVNIPPDTELFQRQYYSIGEVAAMFGVNQSLLRFWENEFDIIQPRKNRKGDRHFRPVDIRNLELIYDLLRRRKLTIEGAKDLLKKNKQARERFEMIQSLQKVREFLLEIKASLG